MPSVSGRALQHADKINPVNVRPILFLCPRCRAGLCKYAFLTWL